MARDTSPGWTLLVLAVAPIVAALEPRVGAALDPRDASALGDLVPLVAGGVGAAGRARGATPAASEAPSISALTADQKDLVTCAMGTWMGAPPIRSQPTQP